MVAEKAFRELLQELHSGLLESDIRFMKFLAQPQIKDRNYHSIKDGLGLFKALEECCLLSNVKLAYLSKLLQIVGRLDLKNWVEDKAVKCDAVQEEKPLALICPFRKFLFNFHKKIEMEDTIRMGHCWGHIPKSEPLKDALDLFEQMIKRNDLSRQNLCILTGLLTTISRIDLVEELRTQEFEETSADQSASETPEASLGKMYIEPKNGAPSQYYKMSAVPRGLCPLSLRSLASRISLCSMGLTLIELKSTFKRLKFTVQVLSNLTAEEIISKLCTVSQENHAAYDALVICTLSTGGPGFFYGCDGCKVSEDTVFDFFCAQNCPTLAGKPKLFFLSHRRGSRKQKRFAVPTMGSQQSESHGNSMGTYCAKKCADPQKRTKSPVQPAANLKTEPPKRSESPANQPGDEVVPDYSDFLMGYATPTGNAAYSHKTTGTFYTDVLTRVLDEDAETSELQHMLLRVNREVSEKETGTSFCQMPEPRHCLRKQLYFL